MGVLVLAWWLAGWSWGQGGPAARLARGLRRRLRVFGGSPAAARRALSCCRAVQAARMRWLRTMSSTVGDSIRGASPIRRHQPRAVAVGAGAFAGAEARPGPGGGGGGGGAGARGGG